jgi:CBS domain-containing protein
MHKALKLRQINAGKRYKRDVKRHGPSGRALFFPKEMQMLARDLMTTDVSVVPPEMPARKIAAVLLDGGISAVPVVDVSGAPIGMVSEGDLLGRRQDEHSRRREWWLTILAEGESLSPEFISQLRSDELTARELMTAPVITVSESTEAAEIADLLSTYRIKRVPVLRDGKIVGIVSRADLVRGQSGRPRPPRRPEAATTAPTAAIASRPAAHAAGDDAAPGEFSAEGFRDLTAGFQHERIERSRAELRVAAEERSRRIRELIDHHVGDAKWQALLHGARVAAEHGEKEYLLLRFPASLCSDGGRAINAPEADWPQSLRGEAAEIFLRWERELKPRGFHLSARVLDFPGGFPGDVGLLLSWT